MNDKKKIQKILKRKCPDCGEQLELVRRVQKDGGVSYSASYEECVDCDYQKKIINKHDYVDKSEFEL
jgi:ssDNA-binding Zn-finger/Zn-ribbon topoisomerase 1